MAGHPGNRRVWRRRDFRIHNAAKLSWPGILTIARLPRKASVPELTNEVPEFMNEVLELTDEVSELTNEVPDLTNEVPELTNKVSEAEK